MAREEAARLHHEYVGTEHILLGLIREGEGVAAAVLQNLNVDLDDVTQKIEDTVKKGKAAQATGPDLPYTSRAKKVLELAMAEARDLNHSYVGTEHLLLGLLREEKGIAAQVLTDAGVNLEAARADALARAGATGRVAEVLLTGGSPGGQSTVRHVDPIGALAGAKVSPDGRVVSEAEWNASIPYAQGSVVRHGGYLYFSSAFSTQTANSLASQGLAT
jgi:hypothetical protein